MRCILASFHTAFSDLSNKLMNTEKHKETKISPLGQDKPKEDSQLQLFKNILFSACAHK